MDRTRKIELNPLFLVNEQGERKSVVLSVAEYEALLEWLEDREDAYVLDEAREEEGGFIDYEEARKDLQHKGLL